MKSKALLLILFISTALFSCKKDKDDSLKTVKKEIVGNWQMQSVTAVGYDVSGKEVDRETQNTDAIKIQFLDESTYTISDTDGAQTYTLAETNGKATIGFEGTTFDVKITNGTMTWATERAVEGQSYTKVITTIQFKKI